MEQTQITPELYAQVKAMVLEEQREARRVKAQENARLRHEIGRFWEPTLKKYTPLLAAKYRNVITNQPLDQVVADKLTEVKKMALHSVGEWNATDAYKHDKADEVNRIAGEIIDAIINKENK